MTMPLPNTYINIVTDIADRAASGEYPPGYELPSYRQLADEYKVGISTVSRAIALLRERGVVVGIPGKGVYVAER
jgi:DNA-binding GntR family transcriptional regulator